MKFTANTLALQKALVPFSETIIAMHDSFIKLNLKSGILTINSNSFDISMRSDLQVQNSEDGEIILPYTALWSSISIIEAETVTAEVKNSCIMISFGDKTVKINAAAVEAEINAVDVKNEDLTIKLSGKDFKRLVRHTVPCLSHDETQPFSNGIFFNKVDDKIEAVGTDGKIMAVSSVPYSEDFDSFIINYVSLYFGQKYSLNDDEVKIYSDQENSIISFGNFLIKQAIIDFPYPNYKNISKTDHDNKIIVSGQDLYNALKAFIPLVEKNPGKITVSINNNQITLANNLIESQISCSDAPEKFKKTFFTNSLMNVISPLEAEKIELSYKPEEGNALIIKINDSASYKAFIMPYHDE